MNFSGGLGYHSSNKDIDDSRYAKAWTNFTKGDITQALNELMILKKTKEFKYDDWGFLGEVAIQAIKYDVERIIQLIN